MPSTLLKSVRAPGDPTWSPMSSSCSRTAVFYDRTSEASLNTAAAERLQGLVWMLLTNDHELVRELRIELEHRVRTFAAAFRDAGVAVEKMLVALKLATAMRRWRMHYHASEPLHDDIVLWSVREYFRCEEPVDARRHEVRYGSMI